MTASCSAGRLVSLAVALWIITGCNAPTSRSPLASRSACSRNPFDNRAPPALLDADNLRKRAENAISQQRLFSPAGNNAVEYFLALRAKEAPDTGVASALTELQPYLIISTEQALSRHDATEAERLLSLLARLDDHCPALPRLQATLDAEQSAQARTEVAKLAEPTAAAARSSTEITGAGVLREPALTDVPPRFANAPIAGPVGIEATARTTGDETPKPVQIEVPDASPPAVEKASLKPAQTVALHLPRLVADVAPRYPGPALNRRIEGDVELAFTILPDGSVTDLRVVSATPQGIFEKSALLAAAHWRFEAGAERVSTSRRLSFRPPKT